VVISGKDAVCASVGRAEGGTLKISGGEDPKGITSSFSPHPLYLDVTRCNMRLLKDRRVWDIANSKSRLYALASKMALLE
jgi:hypothetical protein